MPEALHLDIDYRPFRIQREFHQLTEETVGLFGGWGSGKTAAGLGECWRNTCYSPGLPGILASPSYPMQRRTLLKQLVKLLPGAPRARRCPQSGQAPPGPVGA